MPELLHGIVHTENGLVKVQLPVGDHQSVPLAQDLAADDGVGRDEAHRGRVRGEADRFVPHGVEVRAVVMQVIQIGD